MNPSTYHADTTRISKSGLDLINRAPAHYWQKYLNPNRVPEKEIEAFLIGRAFHRAVTEPETFFQHYIVSPTGIDRRTNVGKEKWNDFLLASEGKTILQQNADEKARHLSYDQIMYMRDAVRRHPAANQLLKQGVAEQILLWEDETTGAPCKAMTDWKTGNILVDFKSCQDASEREFARTILKRRYDVQAAFYSDGHYIVTGKMPDDFIFVVVEKHPPYLVEVYALNWMDINAARAKYIENLQRYMECKRTGKWGGYSDGKIYRISLNK